MGGLKTGPLCLSSRGNHRVRGCKVGGAVSGGAGSGGVAFSALPLFAGLLWGEPNSGDRDGLIQRWLGRGEGWQGLEAAPSSNLLLVEQGPSASVTLAHLRYQAG